MLGDKAKNEKMKQVLKRGWNYPVHGKVEKHVMANISYLAPSQSLVGKHIVKTGGGRGLGFAMAQRFIQLLQKEKRQGTILFMSLETSDTADITYGLTKDAINSLVKGQASMYASQGIRVNTVAPGVTLSDMTGFKADGNLYLKSNATGCVYLPEKIAEYACFLLSDASGCVSGEVLTCKNAR